MERGRVEEGWECVGVWEGAEWRGGGVGVGVYGSVGRGGMGVRGKV